MVLFTELMQQLSYEILPDFQQVYDFDFLNAMFVSYERKKNRGKKKKVIIGIVTIKLIGDI